MTLTAARSSSLRPRLCAGAQLLLFPCGHIYARIGERTVQVSGSIPQLARDVISMCDGSRKAAEIEEALALPHGRDSVVSVLDSLLRAGVLIDASEDRDIGEDIEAQDGNSVLDHRVTLLGNRQLLAVLDAAFEAAGFRLRRTIRVLSFSSCETPEFLAQKAEQVVSGPDPEYTPTDYIHEDLERASQNVIRDILANTEFAVCALEGVPHQAVFDVSRAALAVGTPCLFVTASDRQAILGPTVIPGAGPCFHCRVLATDPLATGAPEVLSVVEVSATSNRSRSFLAQIAAAAVDEACATLDRRPAPARVNSMLILEPGEPQKRESLLAAGTCPDCGGSHAVPETDIGWSALAHVAEEIAQVWQSSPIASSPPEPDAYRRIGILGGGTAGYLTALALRRAHPDLEVTVIESSHIPVIGVGEATTPELVRMLHAPRFLGFDVADFHRHVMPTFKLGIRFQWGGAAPYDFPFPFQRGRLPESLVYEGSLHDQSLGAMLMAGNRVPVFRARPDQAPRSLLHRIRWAYHLDNRRFVSYLQQQAHVAGINHVDGIVAEVTLAEDGQSVTAVRTQDGRTLNADLWIDCSGFRSLLMEKQLRSPFIDYSSTLFTDMAIVANTPHDGVVKPYTYSKTMDAGWCWTIPFEDADHKGYVFSSAFLDEERAVEEMRATNPGLGDHWTVRFRSGRHADFWKGNVVALGNAYGFVEPLQSTALHMLVFQIELLMMHFPASKRDHTFKEALNKKVGERWDALRWFLGVHYRFNTARDTAFWRAANAEADISGAEQRVALFRERAPISYRPSHHYRLLPPEFFSDDHAFDSMLMGLRVPTKRVETVNDHATWQRLRASLKMTADAAMPQVETLRWLREEGQEVLSGLTERSDSWVLYWYPA